MRGDPPEVEYSWRLRSSWRRLGARAHGSASQPPAGSHAGFITEHYWGYTRQRDGNTLEYRVNHPPWRVWEAVPTSLPDGLSDLYGSRIARTLARPVSVLLAAGSPVEVFRGRPLAPGA